MLLLVAFYFGIIQWVFLFLSPLDSPHWKHGSFSLGRLWREYWEEKILKKTLRLLLAVSCLIGYVWFSLKFYY